MARAWGALEDEAEMADSSRMKWVNFTNSFFPSLRKYVLSPRDYYKLWRYNVDPTKKKIPHLIMECAFSWIDTDSKTSIQNNICSIIVSKMRKVNARREVIWRAWEKVCGRMRVGPSGCIPCSSLFRIWTCKARLHFLLDNNITWAVASVRRLMRRVHYCVATFAGSSGPL